MGYRSSHTNCIVRIIPLRGLSAQQEALCLFLHEEAGRCWTDMLNAHIESRSGKWLSSSDLKKLFKGQYALHSQTIQALAEKLEANIDAARELRNKRHAALDSLISRCKPGSKRHRRLMKSKARASAKMYRQQRDILHKASRQLVQFCQANDVKEIAVGDMRNIQDSVDLGSNANQKISQWPHGQFVKYIAYKSAEYGMQTDYIPEDHSTRTCSCCRLVKNSAPRGRVHVCPGGAKAP